MGIKSKVNDKADDLTVQLRYQAQSKYIKWLMKTEECDAEMAWAIVEGRTDDPEDIKYVLGFKLADPVLQIALFKQLSKKSRIQAAKNFAETLSDPEREIFYSEVFNEETAAQFKTALKKEKKKHEVKTDKEGYPIHTKKKGGSR